MNAGRFQITYVGKEDHMMMPLLSTLVVTQTLYDILFQYMVTPEKEQKLLDFINKIQNYLDNKPYPNRPFSLPVEELEFLEEGLQELKLLCWQTIPVYVFEVNPLVPSDSPDYEPARQEMDKILSDLLVFGWQGENRILVYPPAVI
jgi:hypothetical protein